MVRAAGLAVADAAYNVWADEEAQPLASPVLVDDSPTLSPTRAPRVARGADRRRSVSHAELGGASSAEGPAGNWER